MIKNVYRYLFIVLLFLGNFITGLKAQIKSDSSTVRPNVVLIVASELGVDALGCYGNKWIKTPNLDKLSGEGLRLLNAFGSGGSSPASCSGILTGLFSHSSGQYGLSDGYNHFSLFPEVKTLPEYLKEAGYRTAFVGKSVLKKEKSIEFDTILGEGIDFRSAYELSDQCKGFIGTAKGSPFFLYYSSGDPGRSGSILDDSPEKPDRFGNKDMGYSGIIPTYYTSSKVVIPSYLNDTPEIRAELAQYAQSVSRLDLGIGRLMELLKKEGCWENTLFIFISESGLPFAGVKATLYDPAIHLPCLIKLPGMNNKSKTLFSLYSLVDITPTVLDICSINAEIARFQGGSFKQRLNENEEGNSQVIFSSHTFYEVTMYYPMRAVRSRQYKLIWNQAYPLEFPLSSDIISSSSWQSLLNVGDQKIGKRSQHQFFHRPEFELYDLINDPDELNNLSQDNQFLSIFEVLKGQLLDFLIKTNDPWVSKWPLKKQ